MMSLAVDAAIVLILCYGLFSGARQGVVLAGLELISFTLATILATLAYRLLGGGFAALANTSAAISNVAAFVIIWTFSEIGCSLIIHYGFLKRFTYHLHLSKPARIAGAFVDAFKVGAILALALVIFVGSSISAHIKQPVTGSTLARLLISATGGLKNNLATGLGHDLNESLNFFTVTASPESEERIDLGYTTTDVKVDAADEAAMLVLLNHERTSRGLSALKLNEAARTVARDYSTEMFARGFFSHVDPEGRSPFDRIKAAGIKYDSAGENLALAPTLQQAHDGLMKSPGHKANILSTNYRTVGIGIIDGGPYGLMITQDFTD